MPSYTYETNEQPVVRVDNCSGDVVIIGWDEAIIEISSDVLPEQFHHSQRGVELNDVDDDVELHVPRGATVTIDNADGDVQVRDVAQVALVNAAGDAQLQNIAGAVQIDDIAGDLHIAQAGTVRIANVAGDLNFEGTTEHCRLGHVDGDLTIRMEGGTLDIQTVAGDATIEGTLQQLNIANVLGALKLRAQLAPGGTYRAHVIGDAAVYLPDDANVTLQGNVVGDIKGAGVRTDHPTSVRLVWGAGEAALHLHVIENLIIHGPPPSNVAVGVDVGEPDEGGRGFQVHNSFDLDLGGLGRDLANMGRELAASLGPRTWAGKRGRKGNWGARAGLHPEQAEQIKQQVRASVEQAQNTVRQALREARVAAPTSPAAPMPPSPATPPAPPADPATGATVPLQTQAATPATPPDRDAERLAILRMVREGTVTPEEAEHLLAALEG